MNQKRNGEDEAVEAARAASRCLGPVMPIGGAERKDEDRDILGRFLKIAGGKRASILVIPTASETPDDSGDRYREVFTEMGAKAVDVLQVAERPDANSDAAVGQVAAATGIYITGGDQSRLAALLVGTRVSDQIRLQNSEGVIVAGTSAGAAILADHLLVGGTQITVNSNDTSARRSLVELTAGFGLLRDMVIDMHFSARGRIGRLLSVFAGTPGLLGLGIDEATAALITPDGVMEVVGIGAVTILNGRDTRSDFAERNPGEILSVVDVSLHVIAPGRKFDVHSHHPFPFEESVYAGPLSDQVLTEVIASHQS
jgi:cyanophycinase